MRERKGPECSAPTITNPACLKFLLTIIKHILGNASQSSRSFPQCFRLKVISLTWIQANYPQKTKYCQSTWKGEWFVDLSVTGSLSWTHIVSLPPIVQSYFVSINIKGRYKELLFLHHSVEHQQQLDVGFLHSGLITDQKWSHQSAASKNTPWISNAFSPLLFKWLSLRIRNVISCFQPHLPRAVDL